MTSTQLPLERRESFDDHAAMLATLLFGAFDGMIWDLATGHAAAFDRQLIRERPIEEPGSLICSPSRPTIARSLEPLESGGV
ncbi:MAG: hypothetical protein ACT4OU_03010 [Hyphomicrobium sp.]